MNKENKQVYFMGFALGFILGLMGGIALVIHYYPLS